MPSTNDVLRLPSGAEWVKADLHVHSPASRDIAAAWKCATEDDLVGFAIEKGLSLIAITDHNNAGWCDTVREAASGTCLTVLPGVEISTPQGHLLALFDTDVPASRIEDLLIKVGIKREEFGSLEVATKEGIVSVSSVVAEFGGVAIAAHADGDRGFLKEIDVGVERRRTYNSRNLWAMEILDGTARDVHQLGQYYERKMTCLQSSDCWHKGADHHQLDDMGNRYSWLKMGERSLAGLKLALLDPAIRVKLMDDESPSVSNSILGMWATRGFLNGEQIRFNENVSCFIGDTGSGKSVAIELLRFGLGQPPRVQKIQREVESLLKQQLGDLGTVHILLAKGESHYLVERNWGSSPQKPLVNRITESGLEPIADVDISTFFPIKCFSQSEIIEFAREPEVRLSLTDDLIDCSLEKSSIDDLKEALKKNAADTLTEQARERIILEELQGLPNLLEEIKEFDKVLGDPRIIQHRYWYTEEEFLNNTRTSVDKSNNEQVKVAEILNVPILWPADLVDLPSQDLLIRLKHAFIEWDDFVESTQMSTFHRLREFVAIIIGLRKQWDERFEIAEDSYRKLLEGLDNAGEGLQALSERRKGIQERISYLSGRKSELENEILPLIEELKKARQELLNELQSNRNAITKKREGKAKELGKTLNHKVVLKVRGRANKENFGESLHHMAVGSYVQGPDLDVLVSECHPVFFVNRMLAGDFDSLSERSGLEVSKITKIWDTIVSRARVADLYELQTIDVEDIIDVKLKVGKGNYRFLEELSHGQKCMVILMVALAQGDFPLLVDQPEDALHAPSIEEGIVSTLRSGRGARQCIFATRNANILVSADAEQIIALEADAQHGEVAGTGSLDRFDHRQLIIYHVEGGEEAFRRRQTMYSLEPLP